MFVSHVRIYYTTDDMEDYHSANPDISRIVVEKNGNIIIDFKDLKNEGAEFSKFIPSTSYKHIHYTKEILIPK